MLKYLHLLRIKQWTKNLFCFSGIIFGPNLFDLNLFLQSLKTFMCFCFISSFVYIVNDIFDKDADSKHPKKKNRPIASGMITVFQAVPLAILFLAVSIILAKNISNMVFIIVLSYLLNNIFYNVFFKNLILIDVLSISFGFIFRLLSGIFSVGLIPTPWIMLCTFFLALFLGFSKRRANMENNRQGTTKFSKNQNYKKEKVKKCLL